MGRIFGRKPKQKPQPPEKPRVVLCREEIYKINVKHRVTRFDFYDAVLIALADTHPKLKNHKEVKDFFRRNRAREKELKERRDEVGRSASC